MVNILKYDKIGSCQNYQRGMIQCRYEGSVHSLFVSISTGRKGTASGPLLAPESLCSALDERLSAYGTAAGS
jgi:hypothetical protein